MASTEDNTGKTVPTTDARPPWWSRPWFPVWSAAGLAGIALAWLHVPGVLLYPQRFAAPPPPPPAVDARQLALQREHNRSLIEQIQAGRRLLEQNACMKDGELFVPTAPPIGGDNGDGIRPVKPEEGGGLLPKPAEKIRTPRASVPSNPQYEGNLADLLDKATVLVLVPGKNALGSGFFVGRDRIVTNRHVVDGAPGSVFVTNKLLGRLQPAQVKAMSERAPQPGGPDYALLEIAPQANAPVLALSTRIARLQRVVAAGFPGIVTKADEKFEALKRGDASAIPEMALTNGTVTVVQNRSSGTPIIGHEATISPGNSGGPLIDECSRIVGVNTFGLFDETKQYHVNYALAADSLLEFLKSNGLNPAQSDDPCQPQSETSPRTASAPSATPTATPATPATPATAQAVPAAPPMTIAPAKTPPSPATTGAPAPRSKHTPTGVVQ